MSRKILLIGLIITTVTIVVVGLHVISNVISGQTNVVRETQLLSISTDPSTPFPDTVTVGHPFNIIVDVYNPNNTTISGEFEINFTKPGIAFNDVEVFSDAYYNGHLVRIDKQLVGDTLVFIISVNYIGDPYFHFEPGMNDNITHFTVQYNTEGTYTYKLAVVL